MQANPGQRVQDPLHACVDPVQSKKGERARSYHRKKGRAKLRATGAIDWVLGMRTRHIEVFQAVLRTGSISGAARMLRVSQPAVTRTLQHAQNTLGYQLFHRQGQRMVPTPEADALAPMVEEASRSIDQVRKLAQNLKVAEARPVRIVAVPSLALSLMPAAFMRARRDDPSLRVELGSAHYSAILQKLLLHEADVGVAAFDPAPHPFLDRIQVGEIELVAVGRPEAFGKYARNTRVAPEALATMRLVGMAGDGPLGEIYERLAEQFDWPAGQTSVKTRLIGLRLAEMGEGVAVLDAASAALRAPGLKVIAFDPPVRFPVAALLPKDRAVAPALATFVRCLRHEIQLLDAAD